jgi:hypothetical protein
MIKHTAGPWHTGKYTDGSVEPHVDMIMIVAPKSKNYVQEICCFPEKGRARANAALIAAAPELLEALENIINAAAVGDEIDYPEILAAIKKAKGVYHDQ